MAVVIHQFDRKKNKEYVQKFGISYKCNQLEGFYVNILNATDETPANEGVLVYNQGKLKALIKLYKDITCVLFDEKPRKIYDLTSELHDSLQNLKKIIDFVDNLYFIKNGFLRLDVIGDFEIGDRPEINITTNQVEKFPRFFQGEADERYDFNKGMKKIFKEYKNQEPNIYYDSNINKLSYTNIDSLIRK